METLIDTAPGHDCKDFDSLLAAMKAADAVVKRGKHSAFKIPGGKRIAASKAKAAAQSKPNLLIDIQAKMQKLNSPGFEHWARIFNFKEMAKTVIYLRENGLTDLGELEKVCDAAVRRFNLLAGQTKTARAGTKDISELRRHVGTYSKTWEIYAQYRKLTGRKRNKFCEQHTGEIICCQTAKRYFDSLGLIQSLKQEYAMLQTENKKRYPEYKQAGEKTIELLTAKRQRGADFGRDREREKS